MCSVEPLVTVSRDCQVDPGGMIPHLGCHNLLNSSLFSGSQKALNVTDIIISYLCRF